MILGASISLLSIYLTINHKIKNEKTIEKTLSSVNDGDYKIEIKNGHNYATADLKLTKKRPNSYGPG